MLILFYAQARAVPAGNRPPEGNPRHAVLIEYFHTPGCEECRRISEEVLPPLVELMGDDIDLRVYDIFNEPDFLRLSELQSRLNVQTSERVSVYIDETTYLGGYKAISEKLIPAVEEAILARTDAERRPGMNKSERSPEAGKQKPGAIMLKGRSAPMTAAIVAFAGLVDGINPCAFATLIFFITMLTVSGRRRRELIAAGTGFCAAVFLAYFMIGCGAFRLFLSLAARWRVGETLRWITVACLILLCALSFRDAWIFSHGGKAGSAALRLPDAFRNKIHSIIRTRLTAPGIVFGSFGIGIAATLIESVCTGQIYLPTLIYLSRQADSRRTALAMMALYNLMFIAPLILIFLAAFVGVSNRRLLKWSRANAVFGKILLGAFFAVLAITMARI